MTLALCPFCQGERGHEKALSSTTYTWVRCGHCGGTGQAGIRAIELPEQDSAFLLGELFRHPDYVDTKPPFALEPMVLVKTEEERIREVLGPRKGGAR